MKSEKKTIIEIIIRDIIIALIVAVLAGVIVAIIAGEGRFAPKPIKASATITKTGPTSTRRPTMPIPSFTLTEIESSKSVALSTPVNFATSTPGRPKTYTLQPGEFTYCIARRFNVDPTELSSLNGLTNQSTTIPDVLYIPQSGNPFPGTRAMHPHPATYIVGETNIAGQIDTIYSIACYYGDVLPEDIARLNNLQPPYSFTLGQVLQIP